MKKLNILKLAGLMVLVISFAAGCATTTEEDLNAQAEAAIAAAKDANAKAKAEGFEWRDTGKMIKKAEKALKDGKPEEAIKLANKAKRQAELAVAQKQEEMQRLRNMGIIEGEAMATTSAGTDSYTVERGDNLWDISAKPSIYSNPYQWPLIYKANSDKIQDADLIYPGQNLAIDTNPSSSDVSAAIHHAKTRGAWSLGVTEDSDKAYLAQ